MSGNLPIKSGQTYGTHIATFSVGSWKSPIDHGGSLVFDHSIREVAHSTWMILEVGRKLETLQDAASKYPTYLGKLFYFTNLNTLAIDGDDFPYF